MNALVEGLSLSHQHLHGVNKVAALAFILGRVRGAGGLVVLRGLAGGLDVGRFRLRGSVRLGLSILDQLLVFVGVLGSEVRPNHRASSNLQHTSFAGCVLKDAMPR